MKVSHEKVLGKDYVVEVHHSLDFMDEFYVGFMLNYLSMGI